MGVIENIAPPGLFDVDRYMAFLQNRPESERWQLIDGVAQRMMTPPSLVHQRIGVNLIVLLNQAISRSRPDLLAYYDCGVRIFGRTDFQPEPDVAVLPAEAGEGRWSERFHLVAEILSPSNDLEMIDRKVEFYAAGPDNLHVLVVAQDAVHVVHRARSSGWRPSELGGENRLELPEFGFDVAVIDLYRGAKLDPR